MVECISQLDLIFSSLSDPTRRDILARVSQTELSVGEIVKQYDVSFAAISKHLKVMEHANLIKKRRQGKKQMVSLAPQTLQNADEYLEQYRQTWQSRYERLDKLIK